MLQFNRVIIVLLLLLSLLSTGYVAGAGRSIISMEEVIRILQNESEAAYTEEEAKAALQEILPVMERVLKRKFKTMPELKITNRAGLREVIIAENAALRPKYDRPSNDDPDSKPSTHGILGKYGVLDKKVYLLPRNLFPIMQLNGTDRKYAKGLFKLILLHELVHALEGQELDIKNVYINMPDFEAEQAYSSAGEGQSVLAEELIGRELGIDEQTIAFSHKTASQKYLLDDSFEELWSRDGMEYNDLIYNGGKRFMEYHYRQGGVEKLWQILKNPPRTTAMIMKPENYSPGRSFRYNFSQLVEGLAPVVDGSLAWKAHNFELGSFWLRSSYTNMTPSQLEAVLSRLEHVQSLEARAPGRYLTINAYLLSEASFMPQFISTLDAMERDKFEWMKRSPNFKIEGFGINEFTGPKAEITRKIQYRVRSGGDTRSTPFTTYRICRGDLMVEIAAIGFKTLDSAVVLAVEQVFARYEALKSPSQSKPL